MNLQFILILVFFVLGCKSLHFRYTGNNKSNNSFIYYTNFTSGRALKCVTGNSTGGVWRDYRGNLVQEGKSNGSACLYFTREDGAVNLNHRDISCSPSTSALWSCDAIDSSEELQIIYIYISNNISSGEMSLQQ